MKTYEEVLADLRAVVEGREDYIYQPAFGEADPDGWGSTCTYTTQDGKPSCVVGHVIAVEFPDLLPTIREQEWRALDENPGKDMYEPLTEGVSSLAESFRNTLDWEGKAQYLLARMQDKQDRGYPWGQALDFAIAQTEKEYGA